MQYEPVWTIKERQQTLRKQYILYRIRKEIAFLIWALLVVMSSGILFAAMTYGLSALALWITKNLWK